MFTALGVAVIVFGLAVVPRLLEMRAQHPEPKPAQVPSPHPQPTSGDDSPFEHLKRGWTRLPLPPEVRSGNAAMAWTGEQLLVWGGYVYTGYSDEVPKGDGFVYDARSQSWETMSTSPLAGRIVPASAWTGTEFVIWGGSDDRGGFFDDGAAYDPATDSWRTLPPAPISARAPMSVWTGAELIVWGTSSREQRPTDGAAYDPASDTWRSIAPAPIELTDATAAWTGKEMIVFGAALRRGNHSDTDTAIAAAYDPATDSWRRLPDSQLSPQASTAAWNGRELIAWDYLNDSAAYDPRTDRWRALPAVPLDTYECGPRSVSIRGYVFGDYCGGMVVYDPADDRWHDVTRQEFADWGFAPVAADPVVLLLGHDVDTRAEVFLAYRHPGWTDRAAEADRDDDVRAAIVQFMEARMNGRGAERYVVPDALHRFQSGGYLDPMYFDPELEDFEIVFVDGPLAGPTYEVGVRLIFARGSYGHTYFVALVNGHYLISGGRHGLDGP